jgi:hypothetical protein
LRDGAAAVTKAERAVKLSGGGNAVLLATFAAALAEAGDFEAAAGQAAKSERLAAAAGMAEPAARYAGWRRQFLNREPLRE